MTASRRFRVAAGLATVASAALFAALVYRTGVVTLVESVRRGGGVIWALLLLAGARHALRTLAWNLSIPAAHRTIPYWELFGLRMAGEAVTTLTFAGPVLGESAKAVAASQRMPATESLSSIFVENLLYSFTIVLFILSGAVAFVSFSAVSAGARAAIVAVGLALFVPLLVLQVAIRRQVLVITSALDRLARRGVRVGPLERRRERILAFETRVIEFYTRAPRLFLLIFALEVGACATGIFEAYLILGATTGRATLVAAYLVETVNRAVNALFSFVPLKLGVDEGGAALVLAALGYTAADGVALAVVRKIRTLVWVAVGLVFMARVSLAGRRNARARERAGNERSSADG